MSKVPRWTLFGLGGVLALFLLVVAVVECFCRLGPPAVEQRQREVALASLLKEHASRQQVSQSLALPFTDYSAAELRAKLLDSFPTVRERAQPYPTILFHSTMWTTTFLFFDAQGRLRDYYVGHQ